MDLSRFQTETLRRHPQGRDIQHILLAAIRAVEPGAAVRRALRREGGRLSAGDMSYPLDDFERIFIVGAGKAAAPMAMAAADILGSRLSGGLIVTKDGHREPGLGRIDQLEAAHPVPDQRGVEGTKRIIEIARQAGPRDLVICLVSGGGSALLVAPSQDVGLQHLQDITGALLASGADIHEINSVRKHLSQVKGGQLARWASPAVLLTLVLSDVVGDDLDVIASGPTVPDRSTFSRAKEILERYRIAVPKRISSGAAGHLPETPKPKDPIFENCRTLLVGTNSLAAKAGVEKAANLGFSTRLLSEHLVGEAAAAAAGLLDRYAAMPPGSCWLAGGETTVTLGSSPGLGGRNQEMALALVPALSELPGRLFVSLATDGGDGPTDAAGAVVSHQTRDRAAALGLEPAEFLRRHDSYHFFDPLGDLIKTGPTRTNVNDLAFLFSL